MNNLDNSTSNITNGKAIASFILGIVSILTSIIPYLGTIIGVIGLILGIIGLIEIKRFEQKGRKIAVTGVICCSFGGILFPILLSIIIYLSYINFT